LHSESADSGPVLSVTFCICDTHNNSTTNFGTTESNDDVP